jgi:hypothetical protein
MDYNKLSEQLVNIRASMQQVKMERAISQMTGGEILALSCIAANGDKVYPKDISKALMLTTARIAKMRGNPYQNINYTHTQSLQKLCKIMEDGQDK